MAENFEQQSYGGEQFFTDFNTRLRDLEEKQRLSRDRLLLISESFVKDRDRSFQEVQELKRKVVALEEEGKRLKEIIIRISEGTDGFARKEQLAILQKQFDLFRD